jgi:hypothetical protein
MRRIEGCSGTATQLEDDSGRIPLDALIDGLSRDWTAPDRTLGSSLSGQLMLHHERGERLV